MTVIMRLLVTNDDGVHSPGILALKKALDPLGEVIVVAPERPRSAVGHAITLHKPLRLHRGKMADGLPAWSSNGTPADCVTLGILELMDGKADLVVSGINHGPNLGWDVHYSGTVSAAFESVMIGVPAIAVSVASWDDDIRWDGLARFAAKLASWLSEHPLGPHTLLNVNAPNLPAGELKGIEITRLGSRQYVDRLIKRVDPTGRPYFWLGGTLLDGQSEAGSDVHAVANGKISVTPLQLDLTSNAARADLRAIEGL
ncbi:MAG: 5'/3'-nucleotidase SurE [Capsulimonadaceae bacterium]|nr:5'/3'-nucleotidase SurE [Capsulimonadaceae bacterium]